MLTKDMPIPKRSSSQQHHNFYIFLKWPLLVLLFICSCNNPSIYKPEGLQKLTDEELINIARNHAFPSMENVTFKLENGTVLEMEDIRDNYNEDEWAMDYYVDNNGVMKEMVVRPIKKSDFELRENLKQAIDQGPDIEIKQIFCANKKEILQKVFDSDQGLRDDDASNDEGSDLENLSIVISLLEQCGMPTKDEVGEIPMTAIWLVFQHAGKEYRKKYFSHLKEAALKGDLDISAISLMEDRMLMDDGKPQIYGSQVIKNQQTGKWELYKLQSPAMVDKRRAVVGMGPLSEYLTRWDISFDVPQQ